MQVKSNVAVKAKKERNNENAIHLNHTPQGPFEPNSQLHTYLLQFVKMMHGDAALRSPQGFAESCVGIFRSSPEPMAPSEFPWPEDMTDDDNTSDLALQTSFSSSFLNEALEKIRSRATDECWTSDDVTSALLQTALLSYRSTAHAAEIYGGERYVESYPEDYQHNCPWNNWSPPSVSEQVFQEAPANKDPYNEPIRRRVRVRVSPFETLTQSSLIAFASIEMGNSGSQCLRLRRGANILGSMTLASLKTERTGDLVIGLLTRPDEDSLAGVSAMPPTPSIYLHFENRARVTKFCALVS